MARAPDTRAARAKPLKRKNPPPGKVRVIAGTLRGRGIEVPPGQSIRPTADRIREALFNRLMHGFVETGFRLVGAKVIDACAGTGALGIEALSRGAAEAVFIERDKKAADLIRRNLAALDLTDRATVVWTDATHVPGATAPADLALLDPPYSEDLAVPILTSLARQGWLRPGALVTVETAADKDLPEVDGFAVLDRRAYGKTAVAVLKYL